MSLLVRWPVWVVMGLCLLTGCAAQHRENFLKDRAAEHVYSQPLSELWPRVKAVLDDKGYYFEEDSEGFALMTDWKQSEGSGALGSSYTRFIVQGTELKGGGAHLRVLRNDVSSRLVAVNAQGRAGPITSAQSAQVDSTHRGLSIQQEVLKHADRDLALEWELLQAIDPQAAAALEKDAQAKFPK